MPKARQARQHALTVESTTNGIWIHVGKTSRILWTPEATKLVDHLNEALQHCGTWTLPADDPESK